jgi:peptidyl-prolyl cis-trans isomerase A (cyclophilin A)
MIDIRINTPLGAIDAELDDIAAPLTVANFLRYVDAGYFTGGQFWRTVRLDNQPDVAVKIEVVQADVNPARKNELFAPIPLERTRDTGLRHRDGALSMSRFAPDSAMSSFFVCIGDQPELDFGGARNPDGQGFAAFGRVRSGIDVVRAIQTSPCSLAGASPDPGYAQMAYQWLTPPIEIQSIVRVAAKTAA